MFVCLCVCVFVYVCACGGVCVGVPLCVCVCVVWWGVFWESANRCVLEAKLGIENGLDIIIPTAASPAVMSRAARNGSKPHRTVGD